MIANARCYNRWVADDPGLAPGSLVALDGSRTVHPNLGPIEYEWRGETIRRASAPHTLWHFERAVAEALGPDGAPPAALAALLARTGGEWVTAVSLARPMRRENYVLVTA